MTPALHSARLKLAGTSLPSAPTALLRLKRSPPTPTFSPFAASRLSHPLLYHALPSPCAITPFTSPSPSADTGCSGNDGATWNWAIPEKINRDCGVPKASFSRILRSGTYRELTLISTLSWGAHSAQLDDEKDTSILCYNLSFGPIDQLIVGPKAACASDTGKSIGSFATRLQTAWQGRTPRVFMRAPVSLWLETAPEMRRNDSWNGPRLARLNRLLLNVLPASTRPRLSFTAGADIRPSSKIQTIIATAGSYRSRGRDLEAPVSKLTIVRSEEITLIAFPRNWLRAGFYPRRNAPLGRCK